MNYDELARIEVLSAADDADVGVVYGFVAVDGGMMRTGLILHDQEVPFDRVLDTRSY